VTAATKWRAEPFRTDPSSFTVMDQDDQVIVHVTSKPLAVVHLIVTAPELAEIVRELIPWAEGAHDGALTCDCARCVTTRAAHLILAKAEGR